MNDVGSAINDLLVRAWRRKWLVVLPFIALFSGAIALALLLPPVYQSSATIVIEDSAVPGELVGSTISSGADKRLKIIEQRVMATDNLLRIVRAYGLYAEDQKTDPISDVIDAMREKITMELISADVTASSREASPTIAFKVYFEHENPAIAQRVANELANLYLSENVRERQEKATDTVSFLATEAKRLEANIVEIERQLADLKNAHGGSLPEQRDYNLQSIARAEAELRDLDQRTQTLKERQIYLEAQLASISPYGSFSVDGERVLNAADQLKLLRTQLAAASGRYSPDHPDIIKMRRQIQALERQQPGGSTASELRRQIERVNTELARARERYTESHPEIARLTREAESLRDSLAAARNEPRSASDAAVPDNPAYIQLSAQLETARIEAAAIDEQREAVRERLKRFERLIEETPNVEREYQRLDRSLMAANAEYHDIRARELAANLGRSLEAERKSEKFTLIEPPALPTEPHKPNRLAIIFVGFVLSLLAAFGIALLKDVLDTAVFSAKDVYNLTGHTPLAVIPYIRTRTDVIRAWQWRTAISVVSLVVLTGGILAVHLFVLPLDVVWAVVERRI